MTTSRARRRGGKGAFTLFFLFFPLETDSSLESINECEDKGRWASEEENDKNWGFNEDEEMVEGEEK